MSNELISQVIDYTQLSGRALEIAGKISEEAQTKQAAVAKSVPHVVAKLKQAGLIDGDSAEEIKEASRQLSDPVSALAILSNVIDNMTDQVKSASVTNRLGKAEVATGNGQTKVASTESNYVGKRRGGDEISESDRCLLKLVPGWNG